MAVYTQLEREQVQQLLGICPGVGELVAIEGVAAGSINSVFKVSTTERVLYLRVNEEKEMADLVYERDLLGHLRRGLSRLGGAQVPELVRNSIGGCFFKVTGGKYAMLFEELDGRELGVFEVSPAHVAQVGAFLARAHLVLQDFAGVRSNPYGADVVEGWMAGLREALGPEDEALKRRLLDTFDDVTRRRAGRALEQGVIHGDLFINNSKWRQEQLRSVFDWEMAGTDRLALDLVITLLAWCWHRQTTDADSPDHFDAELCAALVEGYQRVRPLSAAERDGLFDEARLGALRFCASRVRDFHLPRDHQGGGGVERDFLDYRDFERRLDALEGMGGHGFEALCGLSSAGRPPEDR
jgi:homoserine kinase type II